MDTLFIRGLEVSAVIGAANWERQVKQTLTLNVEMATNAKKAASRDNLEDALDYDAVASKIQTFVSNSEFQLVETLAERIAGYLMTDFGIEWLRLEINKPRPFSGRHVVGVIIERGKRG